MNKKLKVQTAICIILFIVGCIFQGCTNIEVRLGTTLLVSSFALFLYSLIF